MGLPAPSLMLYKGTDQKSSSNSSHLSYKDGQLAEADFGLYYCIARNLLGSDRMNITVQKRGKCMQVFFIELLSCIFSSIVTLRSSQVLNECHLPFQFKRTKVGTKSWIFNIGVVMLLVK